MKILSFNLTLADVPDLLIEPHGNEVWLSGISTDDKNITVQLTPTEQKKLTVLLNKKTRNKRPSS